MNKSNILVTVIIFCGNTTKVIGADEVFAVAPRCIAVGPASAQICPCAACFANRNIG
jgi:hypothetical protein